MLILKPKSAAREAPSETENTRMKKIISACIAAIMIVCTVALPSERTL